MARVLLLTSPADDTTMNYLDAWSSKILEIARTQNDIKIVELREADVNRETITRLVEREAPQLILLNGHGQSDCVYGPNMQILIQCNDNETIAKGSIVHTLACEAGLKLGPRVVEIGGLAFIGYTAKFKIASLNKQTREDILADDYATFVLAPAFQAIIALIEGKTTEDAFNESQRMSKDILSTLTTSIDEDLNTIVASHVYHNFKHQTLLGNKSVTF